MNQIADTNNKPILGAIAGIAVAGLLAKTVKGIVSFVQNLLPSPTPKEGVRSVPKASRLGAIFPTAGLGTIYGLLFAGLLLLPFQPHRATAATASPQTSESEYAPEGWQLVIIGGIVAAIIGAAIIKAFETVKEELDTPNGKIVAVADLVEHGKEGERAFWYFGNEIIGPPEEFSTRYREDFAMYHVFIVRIAWNEETERYEQTGETWNYFGNGYYPNYTAGPDPEGVEGDADTGRKGFLITSGNTSNQDIWDAFDSNVTRTGGVSASRLAAEGDPGYDPVAYVDLSDMSYTRNPDPLNDAIMWIYTPRTEPTEFTMEMSATVSQYKTIDASPKNTRYDGHEMGFNKSTLTWKNVGERVNKGDWRDYRNPADGTIHRKREPHGVTIDSFEQDQDIDDH